MKFLINNNYIRSFKEIFNHLEKKRLAMMATIGYRRFLNLTRKPEKMTCLEVERLAKILGIEYARLVELIEVQIREGKPVEDA